MHITHIPETMRTPDAAEEATDSERLTLVIAEVRTEAEDIISIVLRDPADRPLPGWDPGSHIDVVLPSGRSRPYSLCGPVNRPAEYMIAVLRDPNGRGGSRELCEIAEPGRTLTVSRPRNGFRFDEADDYLFLAGGIGITPIVPMIEAAEARGASWKLVYAGRSRARMAFLDRLSRYPAERIDLYPEDERGIPPFDEILRHASPETLVYACGPTGMLTTVSERFALHSPAASLRMEKFAVSARH